VAENSRNVLRNTAIESLGTTGSHIRLTTTLQGEQHVTIPSRDSLEIGTLSGILGDIATHFRMDKSELAKELF